MKPIRRIILTTDFSEAARQAYGFAARLAERFDAKIFLVHFRNERAPEFSGTSDEEHIREIFQKLSDESRREQFAQVKVGFRRLDRKIAKSLPEFEDQSGAELLVTAVRRRQGLEYFVLSDIGEEVMTRATIPVLVYARPSSTEQASELKRILIPIAGVEGIRESWNAMKFWATLDGAEVEYLLVSPRSAESRRWFRREAAPVANVRHAVEAELERMSNSDPPGIDLQLACKTGMPANVIGEFAEANGIDLILIGAAGFQTGIGKQIVNRAHCSVLKLVREEVNEL